MAITTRQPSAELVRQRYSCRTYLDEPIDEGRRRALAEALPALGAGPLGSRARFALVAATSEDRAALKGLRTYGFIKGATGFIVGAVRRAPKDLEDYGYLLERAILVATDLGLGTCWLGGSFTKSSFARHIAPARDESMPAVVSTGRIGDDGTERIRARESGDRRLPPARLFFAERFGSPLSSGVAGAVAGPLEALRMAPSASNKQPWRIVRCGNDWHFYLQRSKRYGKGSLLFTVLRIADLQRVDMGIAMCHFELVARESGLGGRWRLAEPALDVPEGVEYTATWVMGDA